MELETKLNVWLLLLGYKKMKVICGAVEDYLIELELCVCRTLVVITSGETCFSWFMSQTVLV
jgi:predicted nucleic acid-binding Zn finger protein